MKKKVILLIVFFLVFISFASASTEIILSPAEKVCDSENQLKFNDWTLKTGYVSNVTCIGGSLQCYGDVGCSGGYDAIRCYGGAHGNLDLDMDFPGDGSYHFNIKLVDNGFIEIDGKEIIQPVSLSRGSHHIKVNWIGGLDENGEYGGAELLGWYSCIDYPAKRITCDEKEYFSQPYIRNSLCYNGSIYLDIPTINCNSGAYDIPLEGKLQFDFYAGKNAYYYLNIKLDDTGIITVDGVEYKNPPIPLTKGWHKIVATYRDKVLDRPWEPGGGYGIVASDSSWNSCVWLTGQTILDKDGDGIDDYFDKCPDTKKGSFVDIEGCPKGCAYNNPYCSAGYRCVNNECIVEEKPVITQPVTPPEEKEGGFPWWGWLIIIFVPIIGGIIFLVRWVIRGAR